MNRRHLAASFFAVAALLPFAALADTAPDGGAVEPAALCDALAAHPNDPDSSGDGVDYDDLDVAAAEAPCRAAVAAHPDERRYLYELARILHKKGDVADALAAFEKAGDMGSMAALVYGVGLIYETGDGVETDYEKAAACYRRAAAADFVDGIAYLAYLYDFGLLGDDGAAEAAKLYERQIALTDSSWARVNLGFIYEGRIGVERDVDKAEALFRKALTADDPDVAMYAKNALAFLLAAEGRDLDEADRLASEAIATATDTGDDEGRAFYFDTRAWVRHAAGRDAEAVLDAEASVALDPEASAALNRLGDIYAALGRKDEARAAWEKVLTMEPPNPYFDIPWEPAEVRRKLAEL